MTNFPILESFDDRPRTRIVFAEGSIDTLGEIVGETGGRRVLLVSDPGLVKAGHAQHALDCLEKSGLKFAMFDGVVENPTERCVEEGVEVARRIEAEVIVAVGGGSAMDCAKGIGLLLSAGGQLSDYRGQGKVPGPILPVIAVPTTSGTGSEVQSAALISRVDTHEKMVLWDHHLAPRVALLDPRLTLSMPAPVTAQTGIDALSHVVESYVCSRATEVSRAYARSAFRLLLPAFEEVIAHPFDLPARANMLLGATLAGLSIENSMLGVAHSCANPLSHHYGIAHGVAIGLLLPHVVLYNGGLDAVDGRYRELVASVSKELRGPPALNGTRGSDWLFSQLVSLRQRAGLPTRLRDCGVEEERMPDLAGEAIQQWTASFNPRPVLSDDLLEIYRCAF